MAVRWYSIVVDCRDVAAQARFWAEVLGWRILYETDDEVGLVPAHASEELVRSTPWEQIPPGLVFVSVSEAKTVKNRLHIDLAPHTADDRAAEIGRLLTMGAREVNVGQSGEESWDVLADPEGNEFCVLSSRDR